jgi:phosphatidylinositol dimannoside acyltransferase
MSSPVSSPGSPEKQPPLKQRLTDEVVYRVYSAGWAIVKRMPERAAYRLFEAVADRVWARRGKGVTRLESNLARVLGPEADQARLREVSKQGMRNYLRYWCDAFRLETWSRRRIDETFLIEGKDLIDAAIASGTGVIIALPHMGNWDHAGAWGAGQYSGFTTVNERLKPERLFERFIAYRESLGMTVLPLTGGQGTFMSLVRQVKSGGMVCLVTERDLTDKGVPVEFFGATTKLPAGAAALALATKAPILPTILWYEKGCQRAQIMPALQVPEGVSRAEKVDSLCQQLADAFAEGIRAHPADWHMLQRLWLEDLDPANAPRTAPAAVSPEAAINRPAEVGQGAPDAEADADADADADAPDSPTAINRPTQTGHEMAEADSAGEADAIGEADLIGGVGSGSEVGSGGEVGSSSEVEGASADVGSALPHSSANSAAHDGSHSDSGSDSESGSESNPTPSALSTALPGAARAGDG